MTKCAMKHVYRECARLAQSIEHETLNLSPSLGVTCALLQLVDPA